MMLGLLWFKMGYYIIWDNTGRLIYLPSGYVKMAMENCPVEIVDLPIENGDLNHSFNVHQRIGGP